MSNQAKQFAAERVAAGLSQNDVAKALGLSTAQYISNVERGKCKLAAVHFKKLPKLFGRAGASRIVDAAVKDAKDYYNSLLP